MSSPVVPPEPGGAPRLVGRVVDPDVEGEPDGGAGEAGDRAAPDGGEPRAPAPDADRAGAAEGGATGEPPPRPSRALAVFYGVSAAVALAAIGATFALLARREAATGPAASATPAQAPAPSATAAADAQAPAADAEAAELAPPGPWRISALEGDEKVKLVDGRIERRSFLDALVAAGVPKAQGFRLLKAFSGVRKFDKCGKRDAFVAALDRDTRRLVAFEYQASPTNVWQAREGDDGRLAASKLDMHVERTRVAAGVRVGEDLAASCRAAGLDDDILDTLDDALASRVQLAGIHDGATLRIVAEKETALGRFARYADIDAVEYRPAAENASPIRVYHFHGKRVSGYFDTRGRQPYKGGWRTPIPFGRVSSRFNPRRMHPILHVVMPHNGVDFGAPAGTPVYAASFGTVETVADSGPSGNLVTIAHPGGLVTGYAHLSRFAAGLHPGQKVDTRQLVGYVGSTGRSTGPHLHFSLKKNGVFVDPLTLKMDGERVLPKPERAAFEALRKEMDALLDAAELPAAPAAPTIDADAAAPDAEGDDADGAPLEDEVPN